MTGRSKLPGVLAEIAEVAGTDAAWALVRARGGTTVYIPREVGAGHWLTEAVGAETASKICKHFSSGRSGAHLLIPTGRDSQRRERLAEGLEAGKSAAQAALDAGMHERSAYRHRKRRRDQQGKLL